ncbi:hypothetical protein SEA_DARDANUS_34 [Gordonia phage Dardanus]|uniref:Uncharacterized protein n=1 Tax=Gordonia phage Dardanus TaxID=2588489 RepID=A0A514CX58_9CAUD|nr:hypothetical protein KDJ58_gp34 [Gordonia phage Dardanus]QDH85071.1 hypothetical protein SEA_DARDANUS_34 [Gordonia phage Dardanus]
MGMANAFVEQCKAVYADLKAAQDARLEAWAVGYEGDEALFFKNEDRVLFKDVIVAVAHEWRVRKADELREVEFWQAREREFFAVEFEPAADEVEDAGAAVFRTRSAALAFAFLAARVAGRGAAVAVVPVAVAVLVAGVRVVVRLAGRPAVIRNRGDPGRRSTGDPVGTRGHILGTNGVNPCTTVSLRKLNTRSSSRIFDN